MAILASDFNVDMHVLSKKTSPAKVSITISEVEPRVIYIAGIDAGEQKLGQYTRSLRITQFIAEF